jgi:DNA modification methylase
LPNANRATHLVHPYPAKLLMHIPHFFLANNLLSQPGDIVLDPFCGSGTVLLESMLAGRNAIGCDTNPLARLIAKVKTSQLDTLKLRQSINRLFRRIPNEPSLSPPDVVNLNYWFYPHVIKQLLRLAEAINSTRDVWSKAFFQVCFSVCVRKVSLADPRLSVPVRLRYSQYSADHWLHEKTNRHLNNLENVNVLQQFIKIVEENYRRVSTLNEMLPNGVKTRIIHSDARTLFHDSIENGTGGRRFKAGSIDMIITSPPYVGAQKYIRASSLSLGWLGLCEANSLRELEDKTLGREFYPKSLYHERLSTGIQQADRLLKELHEVNPLRSHIAGTYLLEMQDAIEEMGRVLKEKGYLVLVVANNHICGREFKTQEWLTIIAKKFGFTLILKLIDSIRSRGLMTKRNKTASLITREWVLVFRKDHNVYRRIQGNAN